MTLQLEHFFRTREIAEEAMCLANELGDSATWSDHRSGQVDADTWDSLWIRDPESEQELHLEAHIGAMAAISTNEWIERLNDDVGTPGEVQERVISRLRASNAVFVITVTGPSTADAFVLRVLEWLERTRPGVLAIETGELYLSGALVARV